MKRRMFWLMAIVGVLVLAAGCSSTSIQAKRGGTMGDQDSWGSGRSLESDGSGRSFESDGSRTMGGGRGLVFVESGSLQRIYFEYDKAQLTEESKEVLRKNADWLKQNPKLVIRIEGHADERGTMEYNLSLGEQRALATRDFVMSLGVDPSRIYTISYGEERPLVEGHTEAIWSKNRRAEFSEQAN
ncbi:peptidoglycan-associated lipoprotein Pal [bacterium]|nr:peptidoglycan-associated lipoprotein Pal [bacterium]